ncbi:sporulation integral membrane protein YlbJ [Alkalibacillus aidingensis]|uniref:sporulation integral membrane protein YlbJ n=1 Tax=Alkalibacillus aidingensis TaxID=2747607 RepID=UPI001660B282|nr:sporulation integral membrane protein YlbJ [Alkalibacillus aidingensis]
MYTKIASVLYAISASFLAIAIISYPDQSFEASIRGLNLWLEIVFPSLLPFFIVAELLLAFGVVKFIGVLLEPLMRPLFNVPGAGGVVLGMGLASGYPSGAKISARLRQENVLTKTEAERLVSFTNASNPLFIFGAIAVGFFHDAKIGLLLAACHYLGCILVGLCMRFYRRHSNDRSIDHIRHHGSTIGRAFWALHNHRTKNHEPLGKILGNAVMSSIQTLVMIGGFIVLFSVLNKLLFLTGISSFFASFLENILSWLSQPKEFALPLMSGLFEITLGAQMIAQTEQATLLAQLMLVSGILAFNGLSIHAQVASLLAPTDIRFAPYFIGRLIHIVFAVMLTFLLFKPLYINRETQSPSDVPVDTQTDYTSSSVAIIEWLEQFGPMITIGTLFIGCLILISNRTQKQAGV